MMNDPFEMKILLFIIFFFPQYCVESCPHGMYSAPDSNDCLTCHPSCRSCSAGNLTDCSSCPPAYALFDGRCVEDCPIGMFKEADQHENTWSHCRKCATRCSACIGRPNNCSACTQGSVLKKNTCVAKCSSNHWLNGDDCLLCHPTCKTCNGGGPSNCSRCKKKALNDIEDRYLYKGKECVLSCPLGTYKGSTIDEDCLDCPSHCLQCSKDGRECAVCDVAYFRIPSADGQCVKTCPDGYYADVIKRVCEPCDLHCKNCVPGNPSACTSCLKDYFLKDHECVAKSECQTRYYVNETTSKCDFCPTTCSFCQSAEVCTQCFLSYFMTPSHKCVEKCPSGTYAYLRDTCVSCHSSCSECDGPSSTDCLSCGNGRNLHNGKCIVDVIPGYYAEVVGLQRTLRRCHKTCVECTGPKPENCVKCIGTFDKREDGCVNPCPDQWLSQNKCDDCHQSCRSCYGPKANQCLRCNNNYSLNADSNVCNKVCHRRYYKDPSTTQCRPCHHSCATCFGPSANQCLTCSDKFQYHNNTCVWQCPSGWYKTFGRRCAPCSRRCQKCLYKYDLCTVCHENEVLREFKCFKSCGPRMFHDSSNRCYPCHDSCLTCQSTAPNQCLSCSPGMTLHNGMCMPGCVVGYYNSSLTHNCVPCMDDCLQCVESDDHSPSCRVCSNTTVLLDGHCAAKCPAGTFKKLTENVCGKCPGKGCINCDESQGKVCSDCQPLRALSNGVCKSICGIGNYPNSTSKECGKCHPLCFTCDGPTEDECIRCNHGASALSLPNRSIKCVQDCPKGYYDSERICKPCIDHCLHCKSEGKCSICENNMVLFNNSCHKDCPKGFINLKNSCIPCDKFAHNCRFCNVAECLECKRGYYRKNGICVQYCGDKHTVRQGNCILCSALYHHCTECNPVNCSLCQHGYSLNATKCTLDSTDCKMGYMKRNGSCLQCPSNNCSYDNVPRTALPTTISSDDNAPKTSSPTTVSSTTMYTKTLDILLQNVSEVTVVEDIVPLQVLPMNVSDDIFGEVIETLSILPANVSEPTVGEKIEVVDILVTNVTETSVEENIKASNVLLENVNKSKVEEKNEAFHMLIKNVSARDNVVITAGPDKHPKRAKRSLDNIPRDNEYRIEFKFIMNVGLLLLVVVCCFTGLIVVSRRYKVLSRRKYAHSLDDVDIE